MNETEMDIAKIAAEQANQNNFNSKGYFDKRFFDTLERQNFLNKQKQAYDEQQEFIRNLFNVPQQNQSPTAEFTRRLLNPPTTEELNQAQLWKIAQNPQTESSTVETNPSQTSNKNSTVPNYIQNVFGTPIENYAKNLFERNQPPSLVTDKTLNPAQRATISGIIQNKTLFKVLDDDLKDKQSKLQGIAELKNSPELLAKVAQENGLSVEDYKKTLSEAESNLQAEINDVNSRRDNLHKNAEVYRQLYQKYGGDAELLKLYGSDKTFEDAQRALDINDFQAKNDLLYGEKFARSSEDYFDDEYMRLRRAGYGHGDAKELAAEHTRKYQLERQMAYRQGLDLYGKTGNAINDFGLNILNRLGEENPQESETILNANALPKNEYNNAFTVALSKLAHGLGLEKLLQQQLGNMDLQNLRDANALDRQHDQQGFDWKKFVAGENSKFVLATLRKKAEENLEILKAQLKDYGKDTYLPDGKTRKKDVDSISKNFDNQIKNLEKIRDTYEKYSNEYNQYQEQIKQMLVTKKKILENPKLLYFVGEFDINDTENNKKVISEMKANGWDYDGALALWKEKGGDPRIFHQLWDRVK